MMCSDDVLADDITHMQTVFRSLTFCSFNTVCEALAKLLRVSRSSLQTTLHILCPVLTLLGNVSCWMNTAHGSFSLSLHFFLCRNPPTHTLTRTSAPSSLCSSPLFCILIEE